MTTTSTDAAVELAELEERVRGGDVTVTAAQLSKARDAAQLAALHAEAARRSEAEAKAAAYAARQDAARADIEAARDLLGDCRRTYAEAVTALRGFVGAFGRYTSAWRAAGVKARAVELGDDWAELPVLDGYGGVRSWVEKATAEASGYFAAQTGATLATGRRVARHVLQDPAAAAEVQAEWDAGHAKQLAAHEAQRAARTSRQSEG